MLHLKNIRIRWMLFFYDFALYVSTVLVFLGYYRGGGILDVKGILWHTVASFICIFGARFIGNVYGQIWRFGGVHCYIRMVIVDGIGCLCWMAVNLLAAKEHLAMSRIISICTLGLLGALFMRMVYRYAYKCGNSYTPAGRFLNLLLYLFAGDVLAQKKKAPSNQTRVAIVGAGKAGVALAEALASNPKATSIPLCFIDNDPLKAGREIHGLPVYNESEATFDRLHSQEIDEIIFAMPGQDAGHKKQLFETYKSQGFEIKLYDMPTVYDPNKKPVIRSFEVEELLFRDPLVVTNEETFDYYKDKVILVTGGGGSIGSELSRQVAKMQPKQLILLDIYENGVYDVQQELKRLYRDSFDLQVEIVSITNEKGMDRIFQTYHPDIVINAAAHKHVPLMEKNVIEAIENNVFGTLNVIRLCEKYHTARFMMLSTDKAVNPTNVMGATKRMCEIIMEAYSTNGIVKCSATRFGNVLGSAGSVIPLFKRQIAAGGPITLTDKRIIRYFMTIPEASQLVLQSGAMAHNGELFVLDMGKPVKILELAENMIRLSGLRPYEDIDIIETGLRPGEKLYEELLVQSETLTKTDNNLIFIEKDQPLTMAELDHCLNLLQQACQAGDDDQAREILRSVVPTFRRPEEVNKQVYNK